MVEQNQVALCPLGESAPVGLPVHLSRHEVPSPFVEEVEILHQVKSVSERIEWQSPSRRTRVSVGFCCKSRA